MLRKVAVGLAALGALSAAQVKALGLGEVTVHSSLNQPLNAEIDLLQIRDLSSAQIIAGLADADEFYLAGVKPTAVLSDLSFELELSGAGGKLKLKTREPIREPFLNFLVEVNWPTGRLVKEYTLLLDPPVFSAQDLAPKARPVAPVSPRPAPASATVQRAIMAPAPAPAITANAVSSPAEYFVGKNDTLWNIALKTRPDRSVSPQQMMLAIQKANPDAFIGNNINRLKSGVVLSIPDAAEIAALNSLNPVNEIRRQNKAWRSDGAPSAVPKSEQLDASKQASAPVKPEAPDQSQLRIVSAEKDNGVQEATDRTLSSDTSAVTPVQDELLSKNRELEEQLVVTLEGLDKVERDNAELFSRLERISDQMESMQRLLQLKDEQLAQMQQRLAVSQQAASTAPAAAPAEPEPESERSDLMQTLTSIPVLGGIGAGVLALLGGGFWFMRKRKSSAEDEERAVEEAMAILDAKEAEEKPVIKESNEELTPAPQPEMETAIDALDAVDDDIKVEVDPDDPFNAVSEIDDSELDALDIENDLDMDLKLDEPVADDLDLDQFAESLLSDEEFDLSVENDRKSDENVSGLDDDEAAASLEDDLEAILAGDEPEESSGTDDLLTDDDELDALLSGGTDQDDALSESSEQFEEDGGALDDLDALLSENAHSEDLDELLAEAETPADREPMAEPAEVMDAVENDDVVAEDELEALLASATGDDDSSISTTESSDELLDNDDLDALLADSTELTAAGDEPSEDGLGSFDDAESELDRLMAETENPGDEAALDQELEALIGEEDAKLEALALDPVSAPVDEEDIEEDETLKALLAGSDDEPEPTSEATVEAESLDFDDVLSELQLDDPIADAKQDAERNDVQQPAEDDAPLATTLSLEDDEEDDLKLGELLQEVPAQAQPEEASPTDTAEVALDELPEVNPETDAAAEALLAGLPEEDEGGDDLESLLAEIDAGDFDSPTEELALSGDEADSSGSFSLSLEDDLDNLDDEDLEAQLGQVLEEEGNAFALEESALEEGLDYLEDADEVATKLDLARAYVDMEDREGAADILAEVLSEGTDEQKAEAQQMLDSLKS